MQKGCLHPVYLEVSNMHIPVDLAKNTVMLLRSILQQTNGQLLPVHCSEIILRFEVALAKNEVVDVEVKNESSV